ncbi:unnamed protein product [Ambrosiozyma monospora]|uniref:Unnamed protein product n=1 Tax=Ambrosiozyma monospora TaxID=43982 RepID=A0ACB5SZT2_AMBMO|nr:unnamed protein product [Ambrosiozyma monospora]
MASRQAYKRLTKEYKQITENPPPFIIAKPSESNILEWHFVITGPPATPYEGGQYHGRLTFPSEYPFKPPRIKMVTPSGRFEVNTRLCLSMSDFHEESWNPSWSVATIVNGLLSFMTGNDRTTGSIETSDETKRTFAKRTRQFNLNSNPLFKENFPDLCEENKKYLAELAQKQAAAASQKSLNALKKETIVNLDKITDSEDRLRAELLLQQTVLNNKKKQLNKNEKNGAVGNNNGLAPNGSNFFPMKVVLAVFVAVFLGWLMQR